MPAFLMALVAAGAAFAQFLDESRPATGAQITLPPGPSGHLLNEHPVYVIIAWDGAAPALSEAALEVVAGAHSVLERQPGIDQVVSIESLRRWLKDRGVIGAGPLARYLEILPENLTRRILSPEKNAALVKGRWTDARPLGSGPLVRSLDEALEEVRRANPGFGISVAGPFDRTVAGLDRFLHDDAVLVVRGDDLLKRYQLDAFRSLVAELALVDGVTGLVSVLSARGTPDESGYASPLVPDDLPEDGPDYDAVVEGLRSSYLAQGRYLSEDGRSAVIGLSLAERDMTEDVERMVSGNLRDTFEPALAGLGLAAELHILGQGPCKGGQIIRGRGHMVDC